MRGFFQTIGVVVACLVAGTCSGQSKLTHTSLCGLHAKVAEGDHVSVTVSGIYTGGLGDSGPALGTLSDPNCPKETAWVEIALQSPSNRKKLDTILDKSRRVYVVFEGEFYGSPLPDPKLPETIRKDYHPGWGHLGAFKTKLIVHAIRDVGVAPPAKQ